MTTPRMTVHLLAVAHLVLAMLSAAARADANAVTDWNQITLATQAAVPAGIRTPPAARALAMVHLAIFDSLNAIDRRFIPYVETKRADHDEEGGWLGDRRRTHPGASPEAAIAAAAHAVLVNLYPSRQADLDTNYAASLASVPNGTGKTDGISLGQSAAAAILALRSSDGSAVTLPYTVPPGPGIYQPDPAALFVAWGKVKPFAMKSGSQFRAPGPPALSSEEYAADYNEVQRVGALHSASRTPDQTEAALFWVENIQIPFNRIARLAAMAAHTDLLDTARLFALLNMAGADSTIAGMDTKYTYNFWRPREAIHAGDTDGNDATTADPTWTPLTYIGIHPDYISQHSAYGAAAARVLASFFGSDDFAFTITTSTAPGGVSRSYTSFSQAAVENMHSRVWLGAHFRTACHDGLNQGKRVANYVVHHFLQPVED
jgi:hypothetical protein